MKQAKPPENPIFQRYLKLLDQTLDNAEHYLNEQDYSKATSELISVWPYRLSGAERSVQCRFDELILMGRMERQADLLARLNRQGGLLRRLIRGLM